MRFPRLSDLKGPLGVGSEADGQGEALAVSPRVRLGVFVVATVGLVVVWLFMWGPLRGGVESDSTPASPVQAAPSFSAGEESEDFQVPAPTEDAEPYREAALRYLVAHNTWTSRDDPAEYQDKLLPLVAPDAPGLTSMVTRPEVTDPSEECRVAVCKFSPDVTFLVDEFQEGGPWVGYFRVEVTRKQAGVGEVWEDYVWVVRAREGDRRPDGAVNTYSRDISED